MLVVFLLFTRIKKDQTFFPIAQSQELKGLAILLILFSHIGYFLVTDHSFLFPLSGMSGIGVDIFLFLSGLGLTASMFRKPLSTLEFYKKNFLKLFVPFWLALFSFLLIDFFVFNIDYPWQFVTKAIFGIFTTADLYKDVNSPFWYFTFILFYYLLYPVLFSKKRPWLSAIVIYAISYIILIFNFPVISGVAFFYNLHILAFPLGIVASWIFYQLPNQPDTKSSKFYTKFIAGKNWLKQRASLIGHYVLIALLLVFIGWLSYYFTGTKGQLTSVITMLAIVWLFSIKKLDFKLLQLFGVYSYEIYLLHWPILYRYDFIYKYFPAWLATILYLAFFIGLAWLFKKITELILGSWKHTT